MCSDLPLWYKIVGWIFVAICEGAFLYIGIKKLREEWKNTYDKGGVIFASLFFTIMSQIIIFVVLRMFWPFIAGIGAVIYLIGLIASGEWDWWND